MSLDTYHFNTINTSATNMWRDFPGRLGNDLNQVVVGVNLKQAIIDRWGSVDLNAWAYTFGFMLRKTIGSGNTRTEIGQIIGCGTEQNNPAADTPKNRLGDGLSNQKIFQKENTGIFTGSVFYQPNNLSLFQAGAMQSTNYHGLYNGFYQEYRNRAGNPFNYNNDFKYFYDFSNNGVNNTDLVAKHFWPKRNWGKVFQDLGNTSSIYQANNGTFFDLTENVLSGSTTYFWMYMNKPPQHFQSASANTSGRQQYSPVIYFGKSNSTPYFNVQENLYPSFQALGTNNDLPAAVVQPAVYGRPQFATTGSDRTYVDNPYYVADNFTFDSISTILIRTQVHTTNNRAVWFTDQGFSSNASSGYNEPYAERTFIDTRWPIGGVSDETWGWAFYKMSKFASFNNWRTGVVVNRFELSQIWNTAGKNVAFVPAPEFSDNFSQAGTLTLQAVKGIGDYMTISTNAAAQCLNMNICNTSINDLEDTKCSTIVNAGACVQNPGSSGDVQYLGWDASPYEGAYCFRNPNDVLCGCVNTINSEGVSEFNDLLEQTLGIQIPNYCWADACTQQGSNAWIDPRIDQSTCPSDLTFCIAVVDLGGNNNAINNTSLFLDCSRKISDSGDSGTGKTVSGTTIWIVVGVIAGIIVIGLILFFIFRRKTPPIANPNQTYMYPQTYPPI